MSRSESPVKSNKSPSSLHNTLLGNMDSMNPHESMLTDKDQSIKEIEEEIKLKETAVGKKLSLRTTKKVILMVLVMIIIVPIFDSRFYFEYRYSFIFGIVVLALNVSSKSSTQETFVSMPNTIQPIAIQSLIWSCRLKGKAFKQNCLSLAFQG